MTTARAESWKILSQESVTRYRQAYLEARDADSSNRSVTVGGHRRQPAPTAQCFFSAVHHNIFLPRKWLPKRAKPGTNRLFVHGRDRGVDDVHLTSTSFLRFLGGMVNGYGKKIKCFGEHQHPMSAGDSRGGEHHPRLRQSVRTSLDTHTHTCAHTHADTH